MPDYQRKVVWQPSNQTRFIDSLAKQLPIPSMCISLDYKTEKRQVVDGLQRMSSIIRFLDQEDWRLSKLDDIDKKLSGKTVGDIKRTYPAIYSRIEDTTIPVTVLRCDLSKRSHQEYLFTIFHRLNTGSVKLTNQEIRNCIFSGPFNKMLSEIVREDNFLKLFSLDPNKHYRFAWEEFALRVIALTENLEEYRKPLTKFLNKYMSDHRRISDLECETLKTRFRQTTQLINSEMLDGSPLPRISRTTSEAIFVGVYSNIDACLEMTSATLKRKLQQLRENDLFSVSSLKEGLSATDKVKERLNFSKNLFEE